MTLKKELLLKYKTPYYTHFIESGTYHGGAVKLALEAGFDKVISVEISKANYDISVENLKLTLNKVELILGDSFYEFPKICANLNSNAVFWLDAHHDRWGDTVGERVAPLMDELNAIKLCKHNKNIIMVDDLRVFGNCNETTWGKDIDINEVINAIKSINSQYIISYEDGWAKNDILVAHL